MAEKHVWEQVSEELAQWIDDTAESLAESLLAGGRAPWSGEGSEKEKLDYYEKQMYLPDGTPNAAGRQAEMARLGPAGFAGVLGAVNKARAGRVSEWQR